MLAVYVDGWPVLELTSAPDGGGPTRHPVFSCTKGIAAAVVALLVQRGQLDLGAPAARYWPEFAAAGKAEISVRTLLSHQAGMIGVDGGFTTADVLEHHALAQRLARQRPYWEPGSRHGYHALTIGVLARELVLRIDGRGTKEFYEQEIRAGRDIDFTIGCPPEERHLIRPQRLSPAYDDFVRAIPAPQPGALTPFAYGAEPLDLTRPPTEAALDGDFVSAGGFADARGLARFYAALATGLEGKEPLLDASTVKQVGSVQTSGIDAVLSVLSSFGVIFMVPNERVPLAGPGSFGHDGAAGALGVANPDLGLAFGWVTDTAVGQGADPAALDLVAAAERVLRRLTLTGPAPVRAPEFTGARPPMDQGAVP
jgi:CubicO group peptidase (beta-lactamase class C family)